ncbi:MAG TPA: 2,3-bisphosphoglycerate-independent phosphoglycerate mutase [Thermoanaerobaculia bacterium]|nr:2,3-bisphosphoglycerate-independent phosphoglycerate mutase [Thermoanaerobaculia bacterium]
MTRTSEPGRGRTVWVRSAPGARHAEAQPFSRGLLARSIQAAGVDLDRSYRLVSRVQAELRRDAVTELTSDDLALRTAAVLAEHTDTETATRYRLVRSIHRLPKPLVIYLGGATGTGKSTLALDLAPLLRIYRINATDTIRQVMRMVFAPAILPALHHSSFELPRGERPWRLREDGRAPADTELEERLVEEYEEQSTRVCVGVRAVVERAVMETMSVLVEGVHLAAPMVPFPDLQGSAYQVAILLTTLDEEVHRARFVTRGRREGRPGERYLDHFRSIRTLQEHLVAQARAHGVPLLETTDRDTTLEQALRLVTGLLEEQIPELRTGLPEARPEPTPTLVLFVDGLGDRAVRALSGRTPLEAATLPTFDRLAREGRTGVGDPVAPGIVPDTAAGSLALFGQSPRAIRRGPVEALGAGIDLAPGDVALRGNFATLDRDGRIMDRRAGRIREGAEELAEALDRAPLAEGKGSEWADFTVRVRMGTEHRLAVVLQGEGLSPAIAGSDPGDGAPPGPPLVPRAIDPAEAAAVKAARLLTWFEEHARRVLADHPVNRRRRERGLPPANAVLTRGAGRVHRLQRLERGGVPLEVACISGDRTLLGLASWLGAETITSPGMTANLDTDLAAKFAAADEALNRHDLVVLHLKGADIAAHDCRPDRKVAFLEAVDRHVAALLEGWDGRRLQVAVASDHATLSESGHHSSDPVPVLLWGPDTEPDPVQHFTEREAAEGALGRFPLQTLVARLFEL